MFYPVDSLKRGGRFHLCWVADSWPLRFATITRRQLWSQDIRKICDDLIEVMTNESGQPTNRFSLRLSSQLMRGLVRLYQRKVSILVNDMCMMNAHVFNLANKKFIVHEEVPRERVQRVRPELPQIEEVEPEEELGQRVEDLLQNSGNVVANIQEITLREAAIPDFLLPPNDGFGEENREQALLGLDGTLEVMLVGGLHPHSALSAMELDKSQDKSQDRSRMDLQMENISELNVTMFRRSDRGPLPVADIEQEIPEIPDIPIPEMPVPQDKPAEPEEMPVVVEQMQPEPIPPVRDEPMVLEELEEGELRVKRRRRRLNIDKNIRLNANYLRERIANAHVELRCRSAFDDHAITSDNSSRVLMRRPAKQNMAIVLQRMFQRNLGHIFRPSMEREIEVQEAVMNPRTTLAQSIVVPIQEEPVPQQIPQEIPQVQPEEIIDMPLQDITKQLNTETNIDLESALTQKIETLSQRKRASNDQDVEPSPRRLRSSQRVSKQNQHVQQMEVEISAVPGAEQSIPQIHIEAPDVPNIVLEDILNMEADKENVPANMQTPLRKNLESTQALLQKGGLADIEIPVELCQEMPRTERRTSGKRSGSETPLGSLDRTKVSLGDSVQTTDSMRFIRDEWGMEGTMGKILKLLKRNETVTVQNLVNNGPVIRGYKAIIAARCFSSILRLKQLGYIKIEKDPETQEIADVSLGRRFD